MLGGNGDPELGNYFQPTKREDAMWEYTLSFTQKSQILDFPPIFHSNWVLLIKSVNFNASGLFFLQLLPAVARAWWGSPLSQPQPWVLGRKQRNFETLPTSQEIRVFHRGSPQVSVQS